MSRNDQIHATLPTKTRARRNLVEIATRLAEQTELWEPLVNYDPISRYYARLAGEPDFEAWLLTWVPGQGTDWHDHGGSAGAFVVVRGELTERHATVSPLSPPTIEPEPRFQYDTKRPLASEPGVLVNSASLPSSALGSQPAQVPISVVSRSSAPRSMAL